MLSKHNNKISLAQDSLKVFPLRIELASVVMDSRIISLIKNVLFVELPPTLKKSVGFTWLSMAQGPMYGIRWED